MTCTNCTKLLRLLNQILEILGSMQYPVVKVEEVKRVVEEMLKEAGNGQY